MSEAWRLAITFGGPLAFLCAGLAWEYAMPAVARWRRIRREWPRRVRGAE